MPKLITTRGSTVYFDDAGDGVPVLFIHGWLMSRKVWIGQQPLSTGLRMITVDLRGHGESTAADFSYADCLDDILQLLDFLGIARAVIAGWSMGAQIAMRLYERAPEVVAGIVLISGTPCFCSKSDYSHGLPAVEVRSMALRIKSDYIQTAGEFFKWMFADGELENGDSARIAAQVFSRLPDTAVAVAALKILSSQDLRETLQSIQVPLLLLHGMEDRICLPGASRYMAEKLPTAELIMFADTGHAPFLSHADSFNSMISDFAKRVNVRD
jgi:pimeloyl-[acyl-carrier protein] methyl ester esterase